MIFIENVIEMQGMGTVERLEGPNGEVPRPLRSIRVFVGDDTTGGLQGKRIKIAMG